MKNTIMGGENFQLQMFDYGSKAKEPIDYMEQLLLAALRAGG